MATPLNNPAASPAMYALICKQLQDDGFTDIATQLAARANVIIDASTPSNPLSTLLVNPRPTPSTPLSPSSSHAQPAAVASHPSHPSHPAFPAYLSPFMTTHKGPVRASAFHRDSVHTSQQLLATGSDDCTIKVFSVDALLGSGSAAGDPLIRTYYDHAEAVTSLNFHPTEPFLISTSTDRTIKFFQYSNATYRRAYTALHDAFAVRDAAVHPSGDWLIAATDHPVVRLYDLHTLQCFMAPEAAGQHADAVRSVAWSDDGALYVSASSDGHVKVHDARTSSCAQTFHAAHSHAIVNSAVFSRDASKVLTCGRDSTARLWDVASARLLVTYEGAVHSEGSTPAMFDVTGRWVLSGDDAYAMVVVWDVDGGEPVRRLSGHTKPIRTLSADSEAELFVSGAEDGRVRVWNVKEDREREKDDDTDTK